MLREMVTASGYDPRAVFELMLNTAQFELKLKEVRYISESERAKTVTGLVLI